MRRSPFELRQPAPVFADSLLRWYAANRRSLPWRERPEPYRVWIAEIMLQQTTVKAVLPYYTRFLDRFPDVASLAEADEPDVLAAWAGLGYYNRARNLLKAAREIRARHGGAFPPDYKAALALPGIGRYTAGAILSIAFGVARPVLDGNVARVFARYCGYRKEWTSASAAALWMLLEKLVEDPAIRDRVSDFNQALMELGATVCSARQPTCERCPLRDSCLARSSGDQQSIPVKGHARRVVALDFTAAVIRSGDRVLMKMTASGPFPGGFWEPPRVPGPPDHELVGRFESELSLDLEAGRYLGSVSHCITHHQIRIHAIEARLRGPLPPEDFDWIDLEDRAVPLSSYVGKVLKLV